MHTLMCFLIVIAWIAIEVSTLCRTPAQIAARKEYMSYFTTGQKILNFVCTVIVCWTAVIYSGIHIFKVLFQ